MLRLNMLRCPVRKGALWILSLALLTVAPATGRAQLLPYSQSFESMSPADLGALAADGWLVYGNVFSPSMGFLYGYGPFPAPNNVNSPAFSLLASGQGGVTQGSNQLVSLSDYQNTGAHTNGSWIESNVFQERSISPSDIGTWWTFEFDAKLGDIGGSTTALAFIKTLAPPTYALTNFLTVNTTAIPVTWNRYAISVPIEAGMAGQILQFGFANTAKNYEPSGIFYDNITFNQARTVGVTPGAAAPRLALSVRGNPAVGPAAQSLALALPRSGRASVRVYDLSGALVTTLLERELEAGLHQVAWRGDDASGRKVAPGLYLAVLESGSERVTTKLSRLQ